MESKTVIVGAGLIGLLIAWYLVRENRRVLILDRNVAGGEASWAGGGIISPLYPSKYPVLKALVDRSAVEYLGLADELSRRTGIDCELVSSGLIILDPPKANGLSDHDDDGGMSLSARALTTLEPLLQVPATGARFYRGVHQIRNPRLIAALKKALANDHRVEFVEHDNVLGFENKNGLLTAIRTNKGVIPTDSCVVAAGAWTGDLLRQTGLELPIRPILGQMIVLHPTEQPISHILVADYHYLIPRRDGRILIGSTLEDRGYSKRVTAEVAKSLHRFAGSLIPALAKESIEHHWSGLRPGSPDEAPFIGEHPRIKRLFVCAGHYRNGFATGPASAMLVVDMIINRKAHVDASPFRLDRPCPSWNLEPLTT